MSEVLSDNSAALKDLKDLVVSQFADKVLETQYRYGELTIAVKRDAILKVLTFLRDDAGCLFKQLVDICGVDYPERQRVIIGQFPLSSVWVKSRSTASLKPFWIVHQFVVRGK